MGGALTLTLSLALVLGALLYVQGRGAVSNVEETVLQETAARVRLRTLALLSGAPEALKSGLAFTNGRELAPELREEFIQRMLGAFEQHRELAYLGHADANTGAYLLLERLPDGSLWLRDYSDASAPTRTVRDYRLEGTHFVFVKEEPAQDYDVRTRPHFLQAKEAGRPVWTESYTFRRRDPGPIPGFTYAHPEYDARGRLVAVWDADLDYDALRTFVEQVRREDGSAIELVEIGASGSRTPMVSVGPGESEQKGKWLRLTTRLDPGWPQWEVIVAVPPSEFREALAQTTWTFLLVGLLATAAASGLGWLLARRLARPVEQLRSAVEQMATRNEDGVPTAPALSGPLEVVALGRAFEGMAAAVAARRADLQEGNARLEAILHNLPGAIWVTDLEGRVLVQNRGSFSLIGNCIGRSLGELPVETRAREQWQRMHTLARQGQTTRHEEIDTRQERTRVWEHIVAPILDSPGSVVGTLALSLDQTDRRTAEEALRYSQRRLRSHLDNTPLAVIDWSPEFSVLSWNPAAEMMFGWPAAEMTGRNGILLYPDESRAEAKRAWRELIVRRGSTREHVQNVTKDGAAVECEWYNTVLVDDDGQVTGVSSLVLDVSQRISAERLFRESEERFRAAFRASPLPITLADTTGALMDINERWLALFGFDRDDAIGQTPLQLGLWLYPEDCNRIYARLQQEHRLDGVEAELRTRAGAPLVVRLFASLVEYSGYCFTLVTWEDVTERRRAQAALYQSQQFLSAIVASLPGFVYRSYNDPRWTMTFVSEGVKGLIGYTPEQLTGTEGPSFADLIHEEDRRRVWLETQQAVSSGSGSFSYEYRLRHKEGDYRWVWERGQAEYAKDGTLVALVGFITDITVRRQTEEELLKLNLSLERRVVDRTKDLAAANEKLREVDRLKSEFLAAMSHELRTPLNSIIGFTGILGQGMAGPLTSEQRTQLGFISQSAQHLLALINDLLDLSRIESGRLELKIEEFRVADLVEQVIRTLQPLADPKHLTLEVALIGGAGDASMISDRKRVYQVLLNLGSNAVKFTDQGRVRVEARVNDQTVVISVQDTGIGITAENVPHLFEAFRQFDGTARRSFEGAGLGLHLVKKLLDLLGGRIEVESTRGVGSTFVVALPLARKAAAAGPVESNR